MNIIILGSEGLIGKEVASYLSKNHNTICRDVNTLDINDNVKTELFFKNNKADVLINLFGKNQHVKSNMDDLNTIDDISEEEIRQYFEVNTILLFRVCRYFVKFNKSGKVFNFSSLYGHHVPNPKYYNGAHKSIGYCLSKSAVVMLTKYLAVHYSTHEFIDIVLGGVENNQNENFVENYICDVPKKRLLKSHEIGPVIEGLFNSNYITGTSIFLDGGKNLY
jgi:NAD(P)-dependent dehydrogenase (short-subunit alcohol dehydrogenase family)